MIKTHIDTQESKEELEVIIFGTPTDIPLTLVWEKVTNRDAYGVLQDEPEFHIVDIHFQFRGKPHTVDMDLMSATSAIITRTIYHALVANTWEPPKF